jgi:hypothetical protein
MPTYAVLLREYNRKPPMPVIMIEANYEFEHNFTPEVTSPPMLRRQEYWTMLSGAAGQFYGNRYTWQFISDWQQHLDTVGSIQVGYLLQLFASRPWYDLVPDQDHRVVTAGYGTFVDDGGVQSSDYLTAARTSDGGLVIAYMPTLRTISVDMSTLRGPVRAQWFDPSRATYTPAAGDVLPNAGVRDFTPPGKNADGDGDWVLVLDAS